MSKMGNRFSPEVRDRAVRMVGEHRADYGSEWEAMSSITSKMADLRPGETVGVLFTFDTHDPEVYAASPETKAFPSHCLRGSSGWENVLDVALINSASPVWLIEKNVFDMWAEEGLTIENAREPAVPPIPRDRFFDVLKAQGVCDVAVIGVAADYCVRWTIEGLLAREFDVSVPVGFTRGIDRQIEAVVLEDFAGRALSLEAG